MKKELIDRLIKFGQGTEQLPSVWGFHQPKSPNSPKQK